MARQDVLLVALALLATVAFAANGPTGNPDKPKSGLPTFAAVPPGATSPVSDEVGTVSGDSDGAGAPAAGGSSIADALAAGVGAPISETFGTAEAPKSGATANKISVGAAVAACTASFFF